MLQILFSHKMQPAEKTFYTQDHSIMASSMVHQASQQQFWCIECDECRLKLVPYVDTIFGVIR